MHSNKYYVTVHVSYPVSQLQPGELDMNNKPDWFIVQKKVYCIDVQYKSYAIYISYHRRH